MHINSKFSDMRHSVYTCLMNNNNYYEVPEQLKLIELNSIEKTLSIFVLNPKFREYL
jgi:hypothetical protein